MHVLFLLPRGHRGLYRNAILTHQLQSWSAQYSIPYNRVNQGLTVVITMDRPCHYTWMMLSWTYSRCQPELINI